MADFDDVRALLEGAGSPRDLSAPQRARLQAALGAEAEARTVALLQAAAAPRPVPDATRSALLSRLAHRRVPRGLPAVAGPRLHAVVGAAAAVVLLTGVVSAIVRPAADGGPVARPAPTVADTAPPASGGPSRGEPPAGVPGPVVPGPSSVPSASPAPPTASPAPPGSEPGTPGGPPGAPGGPGGGAGAPPAQRSVYGVTPDAGPLTGGTVVTINGTGLASVKRVEVGGRDATEVRVESGSRVTARTPSGARQGGVAVVVVMADGARYGLSPGFTYVARPVLSSLSPDRGPMGGGNTVVLSGTHFGADAVVRFGEAEAHIVEASPTELHVVVPGHLPGQVDVTVTTAGGTSESRRYTYLPG